MRRWRKKKDEDEDDILSFDDLEEEDDDDDEKPRRKRYLPPRPIRTHYSYDDSDDEDEGESGPTFDELEPKIRAGKYKPKSDDPWNAHILYQMLKKLGDI